MGEIHVLPDSVVNQIAAGEIIERPVSIVKEVVENSLMPARQNIRVDVERGGKQLIRVSDNGKGMSEEDAMLAFERHATSKINSSEDLHQIGTMGFRGEALASIAAVAQVSLRTRRTDQDAGISLFLVNGRLSEQTANRDAAGTTLEARNLFYNTPARKNLKSDHVEAGTITHIMNAFALAYPEISFTYTLDGREILNCPATASLRERFFQVFGAELLENVLELDETLFHYRLRGFVSSPDSLKTSRNYQYFFINRRYVKDKVLANSIYVAYRVYAQTGQYPVAFLFLDMPSTMVDVNVHPAKYEVRFLQQALVQKKESSIQLKMY